MKRKVFEEPPASDFSCSTLDQRCKWPFSRSQSFLWRLWYIEFAKDQSFCNFLQKLVVISILSHFWKRIFWNMHSSDNKDMKKGWRICDLRGAREPPNEEKVNKLLFDLTGATLCLLGALWEGGKKPIFEYYLSSKISQGLSFSRSYIQVSHESDGKNEQSKWRTFQLMTTFKTQN